MEPTLESSRLPPEERVHSTVEGSGPPRGANPMPCLLVLPRPHAAASIPFRSIPRARGMPPDAVSPAGVGLFCVCIYIDNFAR
jgi:hypothetical protein